MQAYNNPFARISLNAGFGQKVLQICKNQKKLVIK